MNIPVPPSGRFPRLHGRTQPFPAVPPLPPGLDARSAAVLREIVEQYVATGEPVGSRTLARRLPMSLSPATIRNVMADLTDAGLLFAPHTSAGRLPTDQGLRLFIDGLLNFGELNEDERESISAALAASARRLTLPRRSGRGGGGALRVRLRPRAPRRVCPPHKGGGGG